MADGKKAPSCMKRAFHILATLSYTARPLVIQAICVQPAPRGLARHNNQMQQCRGKDMISPRIRGPVCLVDSAEQAATSARPQQQLQSR